jgi:predicted ATPase/DNA-binding SARP family transcriptional activator
MLEVRLIGKFEIKCNGKPVIISSRIAQSLFAYLIITAGTLHRREKLSGMFWPDVAEEKARAYLRHELWRIRKAFPQSIADYLVADDINILFDMSADYWFDVATLEKVNEGASIEELINALSVFQGELLPGFYDDWVTPAREHLQSVYEQKIARLLELLEGKGRWSDILEWAERWISYGQEPEAGFRYLMITYDAVGDRAKVASTYDRCVQALRELDLEPSEQTRALAFKQTSKLNIPIPLTSFIGREAEIKEVAALLSKSRLVTLTGSGGVGKTRLAIQVVAEVLDLFPNGVWFLDLAPLSDRALVPNTLASLLGLRESRDGKLTELLVNCFRPRTALIIFNNCEHLIESCAELANLLLTSCEHLSILATSREAIRISGEIPYRVPSLAIPRLDIEVAIDSLTKIESVRLFTDRAAVVSPGFVLSPQNGFVIAKICQRLDGIPLAIELAAARANMLAFEQILNRLDDRFRLLTGGSRTALERHKTLRAAIDWSYNLLPATQQALFQRLSVFVGGWTLEAAESVCEGGSVKSKHVLDLMDQLISKSLVIAEEVSHESRYHLLETIRQYGREKLVESEDGKMRRDQHLAYFLDLAEQAERETQWAEKAKWKDCLEWDADNFRSALDWCVSAENTEAALRLLAAWARAGRHHFSEIRSWFDKIHVLTDIRDYPTPYARLLNHLGSSSWVRGNHHYAKSVAEESRVIWLRLGAEGELGLAEACIILGEVALSSEEDVKTAQSLFEQSFALYQKHGNKSGMARAMLGLGHKALSEGQYVEAKAQFMKSLAIWKELGDMFSVGGVFGELGELARSQGDYEQAGKFYEQSLKIGREIRSSLLPIILFNSAWVSLHCGDYRNAKVLFAESLALSREDGNKIGIINSLAGFAGILGMSGKPEEAARLLGASESLLAGGGSRMDPTDQKEFDDYIAAVRKQLGNPKFNTHILEGRAMTMEQAIDLASKTVEEM